MALTIAQIATLFKVKGAAQYGNEAISQLRHALQCAHLAERAGASPELTVAALLHDVGHLVSPHVAASKAGVDDVHQYLAIPFLRGVLPEAVLAPIRLHVDAKRYLCRVDRHYAASLSAASRESLVLQGGAFSQNEAAAFAGVAFASDAVALRRWDDLAKNPGARPPDWSHFCAVLDQVGCRAAADAGSSPVQAVR